MRAAYRPAFVESTAPIAAMNMTPLIDVLLVLLVMMILTVPTITHKLPIELPPPGPAPAEHRVAHRLDLDAAGVLRLDGAVVSDAALPARLAVLRRDPAADLQIAAAAEARYERFDQTLAIIKQAGITRLGFIGNERFAAFDRNGPEEGSLESPDSLSRKPPMIRTLLAMPAILAVALGGCARHDPVENANVDIERAASKAQGDVARYRAGAATERTSVPAQPHGTASTTAPLVPRAPGTPGGLPDDRTPIAETPFTPDSAQGAAYVVQTYFALISERQYPRARALWTAGASGAGVSDAGFADTFAGFAQYHGQVGAPGPIDAAAGQRYVTVPVQITARLKDGTDVHDIGTATLHRTADIDGATAAQRTWHLQTMVTNRVPARP